MNKKQYKEWMNKALKSEIPDELNPVFALQSLPTSMLASVVCGAIDLNELAKRELENRGMDENGVWVGMGKTIK